MLRRSACAAVLIFAIVLGGCPKGNSDYDAGRKAEAVQDYDTALVDYERALRTQPTNAEYKLREIDARFAAGQFHVEQGEKALKQGDLQLALGEFQKGHSIDPSNEAADQELKRTMDLLAAKNAAELPKANPNPPDDDKDLLAAPPELKPLSREPINLKMTNDSRVVFETIAKLAGLSVIFDPDFTSRRISVDLPNVTLEEGLDAVSFESKAFWEPMTGSVILVAPDNPQKRRDLEDEEVRTFYLSNTLTPQDLTEVVSSLRQLLDLRRVSQMNEQNAIVVRDTPDKIALAAKIINDVDKAKPEVLIHVQVLTASVNRLRDLGLLPGQSVTLAFNPTCANQPSSSSSSCGTSTTAANGTSTASQIALNNIKNLSTADYSLTLPGATANAILTDNNTKIIQDPEVRVSDGEKATLKVGERVPIATGSFQAGVGVGVGGGAGVVNPLVNTQFTYIDVGVNIEVQPHVHPDGDVSMKVKVEVSEIDSTSNIGGINQPVIGQRTVDHDIRLKDGEVSMLGGLIERTDTKNINGIPGLAQLPLLRYLFSDNSVSVAESEVLIVMTPHVIRFPSISAENLRTLAAGTDSNARVYREDEFSQAPTTGPGAASPLPSSSQATPQPGAAAAAQLHFDPADVTLQVGERRTLNLAVSNVADLYSIPLLIHYNPAVVQVESVLDGGFLSGGTQEIAIVQRIDPQKGEIIVSATRQPNTPGVNGSGTLLGLTVRGVAPGKTALQVLQVNARNSQQQTIPMVSGEAAITVP
ncbi:MAG TPA: cohesin domain-containing protein [Candidatus Acidoferrales bacterium]|nr:cohesin domain-containing protein [Candidatus Acidoferrales bacterium]